MPGRIDETIPFQPLRIAVLTVSDTRTVADDRSGDTLAERITTAGHHLAARAIVRDDRDAIAAQLRLWIADPEVEVVITTGGTGVTGRDVTPEALALVAEKHIAGFGELFRMLSYPRSAPPRCSRAPTLRSPPAPTSSACRARRAPAATAGTRSCASSSTCRHRPCNFAELLPRLREHERQG